MLSAFADLTPPGYNAAHDLVERNLRAGRSGKVAFIDDASTCTYGQLAQRVDAFERGLTGLGLRMEERIHGCRGPSRCVAVTREPHKNARMRRNGH